MVGIERAGLITQALGVHVEIVKAQTGIDDHAFEFILVLGECREGDRVFGSFQSAIHFALTGDVVAVAIDGIEAGPFDTILIQTVAEIDPGRKEILVTAERVALEIHTGAQLVLGRDLAHDIEIEPDVRRLPVQIVRPR